MAEQDIRENQMTEISSPAFIRCLDNAGNSGIIPLKGLFTDVMNYKRNIDGEDVDSVRETGIYLHGTGLDNGSAYGVLIVLNANIYVIQIDIANGGNVYYRMAIDRGASFGNWYSIKFD